MNWKRYAEACMVEQPDMWTSLETWILYHDPNDDQKGEKVYLQAGAGIVADSVPEKEYQECCNKAMALAKTLVAEEAL